MSSHDQKTAGHLGKLTMDESVAFNSFKERCAAEGLLQTTVSPDGDDIQSGIQDDGTLL